MRRCRSNFCVVFFFIFGWERESDGIFGAFENWHSLDLNLKIISDGNVNATLNGRVSISANKQSTNHQNSYSPNCLTGFLLPAKNGKRKKMIE